MLEEVLGVMTVFKEEKLPSNWGGCREGFVGEIAFESSRKWVLGRGNSGQRHGGGKIQLYTPIPHT